MPYCVPRSTPTSSRALAGCRRAEATSDQGEAGDLVFVEHEVLLRSYNSVSLSDDGAYSLTLSDCHGFMPIATSSPARRVSSTSGHSRSQNEGAAGRHEWQMAESVRLLFLPLPLSMEFEVNGGQVSIG